MQACSVRTALVATCVPLVFSCGRTGLYGFDDATADPSAGGTGSALTAGMGHGGSGAGSGGNGGAGVGGFEAGTSGTSGASGAAGTGGSGGAPVVTTLRTGVFATCALAEGRLRCWGDNSDGELGYGHTMNIGDDEAPRTAGDVQLDGRVLDVGVGLVHTCALLEGGRVWCWGSNSTSALGLGGGSITIGDDELPSSECLVDVGGIVTKLTVGDYHTCALIEGGAVRCWGDNNYGQLGTADAPNRVGSPAQGPPVDLGEPAIDVVAGYHHSCALFAGGRVRCWGEGSSAQLGYGNQESIGDDEAPATAGYVDVGGPVIAIAPGGQHTCALLEGGRVRCWGIPGEGILGYGDGEMIGDDEAPATAGDVDVGGTVVELSATHGRTCARLDDGAVRCWGDGSYGLGYGNDRNVGAYSPPSAAGDIDIGGTAHALSTGGGRHNCVGLESGEVRCWGYGPRGALGYGHLVPRDTTGANETPAATTPVEVF